MKNKPGRNCENGNLPILGLFCTFMFKRFATSKLTAALL
jgi:hypothetical protein